MKRLKLFGLTLLALFAASGCAIGFPSYAIEARAEGEATSETTSADTSQEEPGIIEKASSWIEDKVIPIVGGFSIATLVSVLVSIVTAVTKALGDKSNRKIILGQNEIVAALEEKVKTLMAENAQFAKFQSDTLNAYQKALNEVGITMEQVANYAKSITEQVATQNFKIEQVEKMKDSIEVSCDLIAKTLALSEAAVKSGIAKDAQRLVLTLKGGGEDGGN